MSNQIFTPYLTRKQQNKNIELEPPKIHFQSVSSQHEVARQLPNHLVRKSRGILDRYGAVEYVYDEKRNIVDVTSPEQYFQEIDARVLYGLHQGKVEEKLVPTTFLLCQLARAEVSYLESYTSQLRTNPAFVESLVRSAAELRPELIPDAQGKTSMTIDQMLTNSQYLSEEVRYTFHNNLLELGQWCLVVRYLDDLVKLEEDLGYEKSKEKRHHLMDNARDIIEQSMTTFARRINRGIRKLEQFRRFWIRDCDLPEKWTGSSVFCEMNAETANYFQSKSFDGCMLRFSLNDDVEIPYIRSLTDGFKKASQDEVEGLGIYLVENITKLQAIYDFYRLLGSRNHETPLKQAKETHVLAANGEKSAALLKSATIERRVKDITSLGNENGLNKVWKEIDELTLKKERKTLEKLIGYQKLPPRWLIPPRVSRPPVAETTRKIAPDVRVRPSRPDNNKTNTPIEHEPVKLTPVFYGGAVKEGEFPEQHAPRTAEKVKTIGVAALPKVSTVTLPVTPQESAATAPTKPVFRVKRSDYDLLEKLYKPDVKGLVRQRDFIELMKSSPFNFVLKQGNGSRCSLHPPVNSRISSQPFHMHVIHGRKDELDARCEEDYATRLSTDYGWRLEDFEIA